MIFFFVAGFGAWIFGNPGTSALPTPRSDPSGPTVEPSSRCNVPLAG